MVIKSTSLSLYPDKWTARSGLQKSVRRSCLNETNGFSKYLLKKDKSSLWRRLLVTAFEDIGVANPGLVIKVTNLLQNKTSRNAFGDDQVLCEYLSNEMVKTPKDRSVDYLYCASRFHPFFIDVRKELDCIPIKEIKDFLINSKVPVIHKNIALQRLTGIGAQFQNRFHSASILQNEYREVFLELGVDENLIEASLLGARMAWDDFVLSLPLLMQVYEGEKANVIKPHLPNEEVSNAGLPFYSLDPLHTRIGKQAIALWRDKTPLLQHFSIRQLAIAVFEIEGAAISPKLDWPTGKKLKRLGIEGFLARARLPLDQVDDILSKAENYLPELNKARNQVLETIEVDQ